ncbi:MAG TPA: hypothetical protein VF035_03830 [Longimicrobiales bacterium]
MRVGTLLSEVSDAEWNALAARRIFFGHQSVGRDIMLGMARLLEANPRIPLAVVQSSEPGAVTGPAFIEARIGKNWAPETKTAAFRSVLDGGFGSEPGAVAMYKFCYVDVNGGTDADQLFNDYERALEGVRSSYPDLTLVHVTMPLHAVPAGIRERIMARVRPGTQTRLNIIRHRFNEQLRRRFATVDPIFDLALLESTGPDGLPAFTRYRGEEVPVLAREWTYDGGHLTDEAQDRFAEHLLVFLARSVAPAMPLTATTPAASADRHYVTEGDRNG